MFCQKCIFPLWISVCLHVLQVIFWVFFAYYRHLCIYFNFLSNFLIISCVFFDFSVKSAFFSLGIRVYGCILSVILCILLPHDFATELFRFPSNKIASTSVLTTKEQENVCAIKTLYS